MGSAFGETWKLLWPFLRHRLWALAGILGLGSLAAFTLRAPFALITPLWTRAVEKKDVLPTNQAQQFLSDAFEFVRHGLFAPFVTDLDSAAGEQRTVIWTAGILVVMLAIVAALTHYTLHTLSRWLTLRLGIDLREKLAGHLLRLSLRYHGSRRFGDLVSRIAEDVDQVLVVVRESLKDLVLEPLLILFSLGLSAMAAPKPTLVVVLLFLPLCLPFLFLGKRVRRRSKKSLTMLGSSMQVLTEMLQGIRTVKAFRAEGRELGRYREINAEYLDRAMRMERTIALTRGTTILLSHCGLAVLVVSAMWLNLRYQLFPTGSDFMIFFGGLSLTYTSARHVLDGLTRVQAASGAADRLQEKLAEHEDIQEKPGARPIHALGDGVRFENVSFAYPDADRDAIHRLDLQVRPGETLALVGPSGAGKSTLIDLMARFIDPREGRVVAAGQDLRDLKLGDWTALYAMVGQVPFLFHSSIYENILYGKPTATRAEVEAAARAAYIHDFIMTLPRGYDTGVGEAGAKLSGGQRQRITIARAILKGAPLLLLDEATSALDSESERLVQEALENLMRGRTVVVIAHRLSTVRRADRIAVLDMGRLVEIGNESELLARGGLYARLHALQEGLADDDGEWPEQAVLSETGGASASECAP
jgi:ABC-type multidrug transport system fused ATPase/permease subunit